MPTEYPSFLDLHWTLPHLFVDRESVLDEIPNLVSLTENSSLDDAQGNVRSILRADTVGQFLSETWPIIGLRILHALKSLILALSEDSNKVAVHSIHTLAGELESPVYDNQSDGLPPRSLYTFIATTEKLFLIARCVDHYWKQLCECIGWLHSVVTAPDCEGYHRISNSFSHNVLSIKYSHGSTESVQASSPSLISLSLPKSSGDVQFVPCLTSIGNIAQLDTLISNSRLFVPQIIRQATYIHQNRIIDDPLYSLCWSQLFQRANVVSMNLPMVSQISGDTHRGEGLRLSFELMTALAGIREVIEREGGLILTGSVTALIPKHFLNEAERSVQWHLVVHVDNRKLFQPLHYHDDFEYLIRGDRLRETSLHKLNGTAYIGWNKEIQILLGTDKNLSELGPSGLLEPGSKIFEGQEHPSPRMTH